MFLLASVILSGGSPYDATSCLAAWSHVPSGGSLSQVPCSFLGVPVSGPMSWLQESLSPVPCSFWGVSLTETPLYDKEGVVRSLLECILVCQYFLSNVLLIRLYLFV